MNFLNSFCTKSKIEKCMLGMSTISSYEATLYRKVSVRNVSHNYLHPPHVWPWASLFRIIARQAAVKALILGKNLTDTSTIMCTSDHRVEPCLSVGRVQPCLDVTQPYGSQLRSAFPSKTWLSPVFIKQHFTSTSHLQDTKQKLQARLTMSSSVNDTNNQGATVRPLSL